MLKIKETQSASLIFSSSHYKKRFCESPPTAGFQKTDFVVSSAKGTENNKIGFIMRISDELGLLYNKIK
jgi:hypothetical protein